MENICPAKILSYASWKCLFFFWAFLLGQVSCLYTWEIPIPSWFWNLLLCWRHVDRWCIYLLLFFICPDSPMNIILELWVGVVIGNCSWLLTLSLRNWVQWFMFKRLSVCDHFCQNTNVRTVNYSVECSCKHVEMTALYWWLRRSTC